MNPLGQCTKSSMGSIILHMNTIICTYCGRSMSQLELVSHWKKDHGQTEAAKLLAYAIRVGEQEKAGRTAWNPTEEAELGECV